MLYIAKAWLDVKNIIKDKTIINSTDIFCVTCGQAIPCNVWAKRKQRGRQDWDNCVDCTMRPIEKITVHHPSLGQIQCFPHKGEVNELWQPLNVLGELYRPGVRLCGNKDCVNTSHIEQQTVTPASDIDIILMSTEVRAKHRTAANG